MFLEKIKQKIVKIGITSVIVFPLISFAQTATPTPNSTQGTTTPANQPTSVQYNSTPVPYFNPFPYRSPQDILEGPSSGAGDWLNTPDYTLQTQTQSAANYQTAFSSGQCPTLIADNIQIRNILWFIICIIDRYLIPIAFMFGFVFFLWGGVQFIRNAENEELRSKYKHSLIWGIIALFVMMSFWGVVKLMTNTLGLSDGKTIPIPLLKQDK